MLLSSHSPAPTWVWSRLLTSLQTSSAFCPFLQRKQTLTFGEQCPLGAPQNPSRDVPRAPSRPLLWLVWPAPSHRTGVTAVPLRQHLLGVIGTCISQAYSWGSCCPPRPQHRLRPTWRTEVLRAQPPEDARGLFTCLSLRMARFFTHSVCSSVSDRRDTSTMLFLFG